MSEENTLEGNTAFATGDAETRVWFKEQWARWPERVDATKTTNIAFLYGGVRAYRDELKIAPKMSRDFAKHVNFLDQYDHER